MSKKQIDIALDNAIYGDIQFLYVSPERLKTRLFQVRFEKMNVNLIAVDEAHCISQWGYDFRPAYLSIVDIRKLKPTVPLIALTATATKEVAADIQEKLQLKEGQVFRDSFERKNLSYSTYSTPNKVKAIESFLATKRGSGIIYCATRKAVKELSIHLLEKGFDVDFYHGGLDFEIRQDKQNKWTSNQFKIVIATNAFGMGIDKPDVRFVVHYDIPESIEAYYQEAGRAGRDGAPSEALLFYENEDLHKLQTKITDKYPAIDTIKRIYNALGNHFQLAIGAGKDEDFPIDIIAFTEKYNQQLLTVYNAFKFLELCHFIRLSEAYKVPSKLNVLANNFDLYQQQTKDPILNKIVQFILRTEIGAHEDYVQINEFRIARKLNLTPDVVINKLNYLHTLELIDYVPKTNLPTITYVCERLSDNNLSIDPKFYHQRKTIAHKKLDSIIDFVKTKKCKSEVLLHYFDENNTKKCGQCNNCRSSQKNKAANLNESILAIIRQSKEPIKTHLLITQLKEYPSNEILSALRELNDYGKVKMDTLHQFVEINFDS